MKNKRLIVFDVYSTDKYLLEHKNENIVVINVGNQSTCNVGINATVINIPMNDVFLSLNTPSKYFPEYVLNFKFKILEDSFNFAYKSELIDTIIIRCDAGASRSQSIATGLHNKFDIIFENHDRNGCIPILKLWESYLGVARSDDDYKDLLKSDIKFYEKKYPVEKMKDFIPSFSEMTF